jgi:UDP-glucose 4-epimerase
MRIMVAGGAGFIGSFIVDQLVQLQHDVCVVDNLSTGSRDNLPASVPLHVVDVREREPLRKVFDEFQPEYVCVQAAQMSVSRSVREPTYDAEVNLMGLLAVLENTVRVKARKVVFASSGGVLYGDVFTPAPETTPANPISPYGITKWCGEMYLQFFAREHGLRSVALRYSNVFGPRQNPHGEAGVVAVFAQRMLAGEQVVVNGDGKYIRDYVYVSDVAQANVLALERDLPDLFTPINVGTGSGTDVNQLAEQMRPLCVAALQSAGRPGHVPEAKHGPPRAGDLRSNLVANNRAKELLGWTPTVDVPTGLRDTVHWFAQRILR